MENNTILVIDDDRNILSIIELYLKKAGYAVCTCTTGYDALEVFRAKKPMLVVLDVMLPGQDGWSILHEIRQESATPVIMLTAKGDTGERVRGLELGADDYIAKPFDSNELVARIKAVMRRTAPHPDAERCIMLPELTVSLENYSVELAGEQLDMPPKEIELLYFLASHAGKVFTREQLLEQVWGFDFFGDSRTVDVHVKRIREKLGERPHWQLKTVWGVGYKFEIRPV
ncbi:MAG: response regulator transcription factor [Clostridiales bacterium]|nr:response regulator transcription factor [Clostridiales bacterium]